MITRRRVLLVVLALLLVGVGTVAWTLVGLPPVKYYLRYGLDPYCEPTGEKTAIEGVEFVEIGPGIFRMGSTAIADGGDWLGKLCKPFGLPWGEQPEPSNEMPVHWVESRRGFWIATTEVTNAQYERFDPKRERSEYSKGDHHPVVDVSWTDAKDYCAWLADLSGRSIRLPHEAEWECACRAGSDDEFTFGDDEAYIAYHSDLAKRAWFDGNSEGRAHRVATKRPSRWGLHDIQGNVMEWCEDTWHPSYRDAPSDGSARADAGVARRVVRGGSWGGQASYCRPAFRDYGFPAGRRWALGIRLAFTLPDE